MIRWFAAITCRIFGRSCSTVRPASKDLIKGMKHQGRQVDAKTIELRRQREDLAKTWERPPR